MNTVTEPAFRTDPALPVTDEDGAPVFTVEYRDTDKHETIRAEFGTELDAVRRIGAVELYINLTPLAYGPNIDRSKFVH